MKAAAKLQSLLVGARQGGWALRKLNFALGIAIPFNKPHRIKVMELGQEHVKTTMPYRRRNFNHIRGIHACGIATMSEFATGLLLLSRIDPAQYRIIMSELRMEYHYQAKQALVAECRLSDADLAAQFIQPLQTEDAITRTVVARVTDAAGNHVATGHITWQLKRWDKVKTKL
jgi:acyl-coenzyme A thioesterase PaaI-like protein